MDVTISITNCPAEEAARLWRQVIKWENEFGATATSTGATPEPVAPVKSAPAPEKRSHKAKAAPAPEPEEIDEEIKDELEDEDMLGEDEPEEEAPKKITIEMIREKVTAIQQLKDKDKTGQVRVILAASKAANVASIPKEDFHLVWKKLSKI